MTLKAIGKTIKRPLFRTISNTIKKSLGKFHQNKNTIKNVAFGIQKKTLKAMHNVRSRSVKYLGKESIQKFNYMAPQTASGSKWISRGEQLKPMVKRSTEYMRGGEFSSLLNMVSKSKPQAPFFFGAAGIGMLTERSLFGIKPIKAISNAFKEKKDYFNNNALSQECNLDSIFEHKFTQIWLNGQEEFAPVVERMWNPPQIMTMQRNTKIRSITAPYAPLTIKNGKDSYRWFDQKKEVSKDQDFYDIKDVEHSEGLLKKLIKEEIKNLGGKSEYVYIGGFSEGAAMALHTALGYEKPLGGVVSISGFKFPETKIHESNKNIPTMLIHGTSDEVIDFPNEEIIKKTIDLDIAKDTYQTNNWHTEKNVEFHEISKMPEVEWHRPVMDIFTGFIEKLCNKKISDEKINAEKLKQG